MLRSGHGAGAFKRENIYPGNRHLANNKITTQRTDSSKALHTTNFNLLKWT